MKDLRIVIVSWNVEKLLDRCLRSLPDACGSLDWECVAVDNASSDDSATMVRGVISQSRGEETSPLQVRLITNAQNLGFAKACNIGARGADAKYVLFLNPDTECPKGSLEKLVKEADKHPGVGIIGPKLLYPDGSPQPSVRRFPGVWDQLAIVLKISHLFPQLASLKKYFAKDLDADKEQSVDQVMGACFLVRKELIDQKLGFDERYFIWMEEVDFCKTIKEKGWEVLYVPSVSVIHHLGQSFAQEFQVKRQRMFTASLTAYFQKWHAGWQSGVIRTAAPIGVGIVWIANQLKNPFVFWSVFTVLMEAASALTIFHPVANSVIAFALGILVLLLAWKKPVPAVGILLLELLIGSKGQILQFGFWPVTTSVRIIMTGAFLAGWSMNIIQARRWKDVRHLLRGRYQYGVLYLLIGYAVLVGIDLKNGSSVLKDANAWMDWLLLFPVLDVVAKHRDQIKKQIAPIFAVGVLWLAVKTLGLEYLFSHGFKSIAPDAYLWVRRTGVAEVTLVVANAFRIFMQSYVYATAGVLFGGSWLLASEDAAGDASGNFFVPMDIGIKKVSRAVGPAAIAWLVVCASVVILGISLSRSFWIGTAIGGLMLLLVLSAHRVAWWKKLLSPISAAIAGVVLMGVVLAFPIPRVSVASLGDLFGSRTDVTNEAAAASRWNLMPVLWHKILEHPILGSGFGATVTYLSKDPRIIAQTGTGEYTTYAFEWGWIEHWIKFGILGIPMILWLLLSLGARMWKTKTALWFRAGFISSLIALAVLHFFTPYLNHPLGFLYFFVGEAIIVLSYESKSAGGKRIDSDS